MKTLTIYLTGSCNLRCKHCSVGLDQYKVRQELPDRHILKILDRAAERGVRFVTFLGGEPATAPQDLERICAHAHELGLALSFNTNLVELARIEALLKYPSVKNIVVSLDGASAPVHDQIRGTHTFEKTTKNIAILLAQIRTRDLDVAIDLTFALSKMNQCDSVAIVKLAVELGVNGLNINIVQPIGRARQFAAQVQGDGRRYLDAIAQAIAYFVLAKPALTLSIPLAPMVSEYLSETYRVPASLFENDAACGGTSVYTYVDLKGNLLPCPGYSFEEAQNDHMNRQHSHLSIVDWPIRDIENTQIFRSFEANRKSRSKNTLFHPCNRCRFSATCSPCISSYYKNAENHQIFLCAQVHDLINAEAAHGPETTQKQHTGQRRWVCATDPRGGSPNDVTS